MTRSEIQAKIYELEVQRRALVRSVDQHRQILRNLHLIARRLRNAEICRRIYSGQTQLSVARSFGLSAAIVGVIYHRHLRRRDYFQNRPAAVRDFHVRLAEILEDSDL